MDEQYYFEKLKFFFETKSICKEAAAPLKKGAAVEIRNPESGQSYHFVKENQGAQVNKGAPRECELYFEMPPKALEYIADFECNDIGRYGIRVFETMISSDPAMRMKVKFKAGPIKLGLKGYFGVLMLGGKTIWQWLAQHGIGGLSKAKDIISKFRG